jgi:hypothetical protein
MLRNRREDERHWREVAELRREEKKAIYFGYLSALDRAHAALRPFTARTVTRQPHDGGTVESALQELEYAQLRLQLVSPEPVLQVLAGLWVSRRAWLPKRPPAQGQESQVLLGAQ